LCCLRAISCGQTQSALHAAVTTSNDELGSIETKGPASASPFSPRLDAGVDFYFLAFFAFFFFTIVSSFCSDIGKSEVCLGPINGPNPFSYKSRDLFHTMVNKIEGPELASPTLDAHRSPTGAVGDLGAHWLSLVKAIMVPGCFEEIISPVADCLSFYLKGGSRPPYDRNG